MSKMRKTLDREQIVEAANLYIRTAHTEDERKGVAFVVESILINGNSYKGFQWVDKNGDQLPIEEAQKMTTGVDGYYRRRYH